MKLVETPPGPPVIASVVAESTASRTIATRTSCWRPTRCVPAWHSSRAWSTSTTSAKRPKPKIIFVPDQEKAAMNGITTEQIAGTLKSLLEGGTVGLVRSDTERNPLRIELRVPADERTSAADLAKVGSKAARSTRAVGRIGQMGNAPRRPDDLPQEPAARGLCLRRDGRTTAGRRGRRRAGRPDRTNPRRHGDQVRPRRQRLAGRQRAAPAGATHLPLQRQRRAWGVPAGFTVDFRRRRRVEDHARRVPRPRPGLRRGDDRHLRAAGCADRLVRHSGGRHAGHPADDPGRHAGLLAAECAQRPAGGRVSSIRSISRPRA